MKRRTFIWTPLLLSLGSAFKVDAHADLAASLSAQNSTLTSQCDTLLGCFTNSADAAEVGRRYLEGLSEQTNIEQLMRDVGLSNSEPTAQVLSANARFEAAKQYDFTHGKTVCLDGWVLSQAEASLCALAHLSPTHV